MLAEKIPSDSPALAVPTHRNPDGSWDHSRWNCLETKRNDYLIPTYIYLTWLRFAVTDQPHSHVNHHDRLHERLLCIRSAFT